LLVVTGLIAGGVAIGVAVAEGHHDVASALSIVVPLLVVPLGAALLMGAAATRLDKMVAERVVLFVLALAAAGLFGLGLQAAAH
jgi:hypothetical protein